MTWEDPIVADVRRTRQNLSAQFDFDLAAIFADMRNRQEELGDRLVRLAHARRAEQGDAPERPVASPSDG